MDYYEFFFDSTPLSLPVSKLRLTGVDSVETEERWGLRAVMDRCCKASCRVSPLPKLKVLSSTLPDGEGC